MVDTVKVKTLVNPCGENGKYQVPEGWYAGPEEIGWSSTNECVLEVSSLNLWSYALIVWFKFYTNQGF